MYFSSTAKIFKRFNVRITAFKQGRCQVKICGVDKHGERGARAYNGGLEAERPPVKTRRIYINFRSDL